MKIGEKALLDLVKIGATGECLFGDGIHNADWNKMFKLACKQGVAGVAWRGIEILYKHEVNECPQEVKLQWFAYVEQVRKAAAKHLADAVKFAEAIKPLQVAVLKGIDYAQYWQEPELREFGDLDIVLVENGELAITDSKKIDDKAREIGCKLNEDSYKHTEIYFEKMMVENHHCFIGFAGSKENEELERELRKLFSVESLDVRDENSLFSPSVNFTAVFMLAHAYNHFFLEGVVLRHIMDWHFFLTKEGGNVDWSAIKPVLKKTGLMPFAVLITRFCKKFFGLRIDMGSSCRDDLLEMFAVDVFSEKISENDRRWHILIKRMLLRYYRMWKFRELMRMPIGKAIWRTIAYSSFLHRKPKLVL